MQNKRSLGLGKDKEVFDKEDNYFGRSSYMQRKEVAAIGEVSQQEDHSIETVMKEASGDF